MFKDYKGTASLKKIAVEDLELLAADIRTDLIQCVSENGGHLASNLGIVELSIALHYVFDCPNDKLVFDVGHQSYVHKMLTGRWDLMNSLRKSGGLSGFPDPQESETDCFVAGHASNAISAALGMLRAGKSQNVVAIVGDGALTGGMCYEALNDAGQSKIPIIIVLNDNEMSISKNVGAMSFYLDRLRRASGYRKAKEHTRNVLTKIPRVGDSAFRGIERIRDSIKTLFIRGTFFETLGFNYIGPVDGHDIRKLIRVLERAKDTKEPLVVHVVTQKGKGYQPAEDEPAGFHGVAPFFIDSGLSKKAENTLAYGQEAARILTALADSDSKICVICAAMTKGTGMELFMQTHPEMFYDVGIAEEHAVTMAAGLASEGKHPFVAIYSTFLQRGYDQMMIDVCRNKLPVTFLVDRSGLNGADGRTHQGVYDISYLNSIPDLTIAGVRDIRALRRMVRFAVNYDKPLALRYSRESIDLGSELDHAREIIPGKWEELTTGNVVVIIAEGPAVDTALQAAIKLSGIGISCGVTDACFIKPIDEAYLDQLKGKDLMIVTLEENTINGGLGSIVDVALAARRFKGIVLNLGIKDVFVEHGTIAEQRSRCGIDADSVVNAIRTTFSEDRL